MEERYTARNALVRCRRLACAAVMTLAIGGAALAAPPETVINKWCPVMTDEEIDPDLTIEYRGKTIAFCCDICIRKFRANPAKYESRLPQFAQAAKAAVAEPERAPGRGPLDSQSLGDQADPNREDLSASVDQDEQDYAPAAPDDEREPILGRLHPIVIHFPLAGMPLAMLGFLVWVRTGREAFARADVIPLFVSTLASIAAVITGNIAHDSMRFSESLRVIVDRHQYASTAMMVIAICLSIIRLWRWNRLTDRWRWVYGSGLAIACALLGYTGFLGGSLVFGPDHLAW